jgi:DNA-directed RNA polymerase subunit RPC12/RpoP
MYSANNSRPSMPSDGGGSNGNEIILDRLEMMVENDDWNSALPFCPACKRARVPFTRDGIKQHKPVNCPECGAKIGFRNATVLMV